MTLAWNLLFCIEDCMAVKWGSTVCTVIKWGSTVCSQVKWGNTKVWPDASGGALYSYGSNPLACDIGNAWNNSLHGTGVNGGGAYITGSAFSVGSSNVSITGSPYIFYINTTANDTWWKSTTKIKIVCNLTFSITKNTYQGSPQLRVGSITGTGAMGNDGFYSSTFTGMTAYYNSPVTWTGGTYNLNTFTNNSNFIRVGIQIDRAGTYCIMTGTISEVILMQ